MNIFKKIVLYVTVIIFGMSSILPYGMIVYAENDTGLSQNNGILQTVITDVSSGDTIIPVDEKTLPDDENNFESNDNDSENNITNPGAAPISNITQNQVKIIYELNGGITDNPSFIKEGESFILNKPNKVGFIFTGWTGSNGDIPETDVVVNYSENILIYTANWIEEIDINNNIPDISDGDSIISLYGTGNFSAITYNLDGGAADNPDAVEEGVPIVLNNPTKEGYRFLGWTGSNGDIPEKEITVTYTGSDLSYTANWEQEYKITINYSSGNIDWSENVNPTAYTSSDEDITLINPVRNGYIFSGWKGTDISGTSKEVVIPSGSTGDRTYTAIFTAIYISSKQITGKYKYNSVKFSSSTNESLYNKGNGYISYATITSAAGYYADNISVTNNAGDVIPYEIINSEGQSPWERTIGFNPTDDTRYTVTYESMSYAPDWEIYANINTKEISLSEYVGDVEKITLPKSYDVLGEKYNVRFPMNLPNVEKDGFKFIGWTGSNGSTPQTNLYVTKPDDSVETLTYTANWVAAYNITYDLDGGSYNVNTKYPKIYAKGDNTTLVPPIKSGYYFVGWTGSNGDVPEYNYRIPSNVTGDLSFKANWAVGYPITYNLNGGSISWSGKENPIGYSSADDDITLINPVKEGYIFTGWQYVKNYQFVTEKEVVIRHGSIGSLNYTAMYNPISVKISQVGKYHSSTINTTSSIDEGRYNKGGYFVITKVNDEKWSGYTVKNLSVIDSNNASIPCETEDTDDGMIVKFNPVENNYSYTVCIEYESAIPDWDYDNYIDSGTGNHYYNDSGAGEYIVKLTKYVGQEPNADVVVKSHYIIGGKDFKTIFEAGGSSQLFLEYGPNIKTITVEATDGIMIKTKNCSGMFESRQKYNSSTGQYEDVWYGCKNVERIDLSGLDLTEVEYISRMFNGCEKLKEIVWGPIDTEKITTLYYVFTNCRSLENVDFVSTWNTSNVTCLSNTFADCKKVRELPISNWDVSKVGYAFCFASGCSSLEDVNFINSWSFDSLDGLDSNTMFLGCNSLKNVDITFHLENNTNSNIQKYHYSFQGMFKCCEGLETASVSFILPDGAKPVSVNQMFLWCQKLKSAKLKSNTGFSGLDGLFSMNDITWRDNCLEKVEFETPISEDNVNSVSEAFSNCNILKYLDLSFWKATNITDMRNFFKNCSNIEYLNISNISLTNLTENDYNKNIFKDLASLAKFDTPATKASFDIPLPHTMVDLDGNLYDVIPDTSKTIYKPFYLTYDLDGGREVATNPTNYTIDTPTFTLINPEKSGYDFVGWTEDNGITVTKTVTIEKGSAKDRNFKAVWEEKKYNIITDIKGKGTVEVIDKASEGEEVPITVTPADGYKFSKIIINDGNGNKIYFDETFIMPASDVTVFVTFSEIKKPEPPITPIPEPDKKQYNIITDINGKGTVNIVDKAYEKETVFIEIVPAEGYKFKSVVIKDVNEIEIPFTNCFIMPASDVTVSVTFLEIKKTPVNPVRPTPDDPEPEKPVPDEPQPIEPEDPPVPIEPEFIDEISDDTENLENKIQHEQDIKCYIHFIILVACILYLLLIVFTKKESWKYRTLLLGINIFITVICICLGFCKWDWIFGIINIVLSAGLNIALSIWGPEKEELEESDETMNKEDL